jgi:hypothetical protein
MSVLSWRAWQAHLAPRSNQQPQYLQTALSMQLAPRSTQQPKYSLEGHDLDVAFALHIMGVYVRPFFLGMNMTRQTSRRCRRAPPIHYQFVVRPSVRPSFLHSFTGIWQAAQVAGALHRPSTKYSFNGPIHDAFILSWHREARTHSSLVSS